MKDWIHIALGISGLAGVIGSGLLAWLIAVRYRLPQLEQRVKALEDVNIGEVRTLVHKQEIYSDSGKPFYMHRADCEKAQYDCRSDRSAQLSQISYEFKAIRAQLDAMEEARARARIQMIAFMAAVKEKLALKFTIPDD